MRWTALADASAIVGSPATRATGTIGGNLMNASPAADTTAPARRPSAANVMLRAIGRGSRIVPSTGWRPARAGPSAAPGRAADDRDRAAARPGQRLAYVRLEYRRAMEIAVVGAAAS